MEWRGSKASPFSYRRDLNWRPCLLCATTPFLSPSKRYPTFVPLSALCAQSLTPRLQTHVLLIHQTCSRSQIRALGHLEADERIPRSTVSTLNLSCIRPVSRDERKVVARSGCRADPVRLVLHFVFRHCSVSTCSLVCVSSFVCAPCLLPLPPL